MYTAPFYSFFEKLPVSALIIHLYTPWRSAFSLSYERAEFWVIVELNEASLKLSVEKLTYSYILEVPSKNVTSRIYWLLQEIPLWFMIGLLNMIHDKSCDFDPADD